ncbi:MAG: hypothetical protein GY844_15585 [Bradyrhizobium sp.]|nr:hypothetical protein [Bradyrhizobium sp.]
MGPAVDVSVSHRPWWLAGLLLALAGFAVWTAFSLWPGLTQPAQPFRIREAWDTALFWRVGVPLMLLAQAMAGAVIGGGLRWQPLWMLGGLFAGVLLVHPPGGDFGLFPLAVVLIGGPTYLVLLAAAAAGRSVGEFLAD